MMKHVRKIKTPSWMKLEGTKSVMKALNGKAREPQALFVGGCVRDTLLGIADEDTDIDIATRLKPEQVIDQLNAAGIRSVPTGIEHGTVTGIAGGSTFEITTLRHDIETDGRHAVVGFTQDWHEDVMRRDFTMNTLLADMEGRIYDPLGRGLEDLEEGRVIFVGDPEQRIAEDFLRILRFFRFHAYYGKGEPDSGALQACKKFAPKIVTLSRERITQEFLKIINAEDPLPVLRQMDDNGVLSTILPTDYPQEVLRRLCKLQESFRLVSVASRLLVLIDLDTGNLPALESSISMSGALKKEIQLINQALLGLSSGSISSDKELIYRYKKMLSVQAILLDHALNEGSGNLNSRIELVKSWRPPELPISGQDVLATGIPPGPAVGAILSRIEQWWVEHDFAPDRQSCLDQIKAD